MKRWTAVEVVWTDAHGGDVGWDKLDKKVHRPEVARTVGMFHTKTKDGITIVMSRTTVHNDEVAGGYVFIPHVNVISIRKLT